MPEGAPRDGKEEAKSKSKDASPRRKPSGNTARAKVELLDGSTMDLDVDRKIRGHDLLSKVCDNLNLVEKDYFGLLYEDRGDSRVWIDLEKRVSKMLKYEPWMVRFAVKFYPPEPAQLQEELTRYQLVLAVRKDLLEGRLPCSSVTHALLASYLLQSELGDFEETEVGAGMCKQLKLVPPSSCTPELEEKVVDLHRTHRGQTPAEAELNYLENAKKLAMYGVDLHPAKDSENVDITLGVCSSGLLVHREKLRINRFAWPKILKISYKRHNFYVKLRPGEFEQFESTVGFKLANHRAAKKLWKTCVEHHTFFRLMSPEPAAKSSLFPRLGSRFRYSGRTHYESRAALPQRTPPHFARTLSNRKLSSRSMDALAAGEKEEAMPPEAVKRHTMPPQPAPRPTVKDKKPPAGAVRVMPTGAPDKKDEKRTTADHRKPAENGTDTASDPGLTNNADTTPKKSKGGFGLFGPRNKSPKPDKSPKRDKSPKDEKSPKSNEQKVKVAKEKVPVLDTSYESSNLDSSVEKTPIKEGKPSFTKPYEYTDTERSPTRAKPFIQGGFSYDKEPISDERQRALDESQSPTTRKAGLAFNYAPGEDKKVAESVEKRKTPEDLSKLKTPGIDYVQSAVLKEQAKNLIDPTLALLDAERAHHEVPTAIPIVASKSDNEIQIVIITGKYNPKSKKLDDANGTVLVTKGTLNKANGKIQTDKELINTKSGQVNYTDPASGKQEVKNGHVDSKSGHILFTSNVIDPKTGKLDPTLAQQYCFVEKLTDKVGVKSGREVDLVVIRGKYDGKHKKLDASHGHVELSRAVVCADGIVSSNYGSIDPRSGKLDYIDLKTGKQEPKQAYVDQKTGNILVTTGVVDPKSGKVDTSLGQQFSIVEKDATKANREVRLVIITSKYDLKNRKLEPTFAHVDSVKGVLSGADGKIYTEYGIIDPRTGEIQVTDPKTGKQETKQAQIDTKTGNILLLSGVKDPRTGQLDTSLGQQYSIVDKPIDIFATVPGKEVQVVAITGKYDSKNKKLDNPNGFVETSHGIISDKDGKVHTNFGILDLDTGKIHFTDPKTGKKDFKQANMDSKTGSFILTSGVIDPKTGKTDSSLAQQLTLVDKDAPIGFPEKYANLVIVTSKYDPKNKKLDTSNAHIDNVLGKYGSDEKVYTDFGIVNPVSGEITFTDASTGKQEVKKAIVDPKTGNLLLTSGVVDPHTGHVDSTLGQQISVVDKPKDRFSSVPGKEVQIVVITSKYDQKYKRLDNPNGYVETSRGIIAKDGRIHSNFGFIDPKTGKIEHIDTKTGKQDIKQAIADPKTGHLILSSGVVDPKTGKVDLSLAQQITIIDQDSKGISDKYVNLVFVTSKYDNKNKKFDMSDAHVDMVPGKVTSDNKVLTEFGLVDPNNGEIIITNTATGRQDTKRAIVDPHTGNLHLTSSVVDPVSGEVDPNFGQQISIVEKPKDTFPSVTGKEVELVVITSKYDPRTKKIDSPNGYIETSRGIIASDGRIHSNFGIIDSKIGKIDYVDPYTGKQDVKQTLVDPKSGHMTVTSGVVDPKTRKVDPTLGQQLSIIDKHAPKSKYVNLVIVTSKYDLKNKKIDLANAHFDTLSGKTGADGKVHTDSIVLDTVTGEITTIEPRSGKRDTKKAVVDPKTGNLTLSTSVVDPATGIVDPSLAQQITVIEKPKDTFMPVTGKEVQLVIITNKYDTKNKKLENANGHIVASRGIIATDGRIHSNYGIIDPNSGKIEQVDPKTGKHELKQGLVDPKTGHITMTSGVIDPKTGRVDQSLCQQLVVVDKYAPKEKYVNLVILTSKYDSKNKKLDINNAHIDTMPGKIGANGIVHTDFGYVDPANGEITFVDQITGTRDIKKALVDTKTGNLSLTSGVADPYTGLVDQNLAQQISVVERPKDVFNPVPGKEVQLVIITSKYDTKNKKLDNPNGHIETSRGIIAADGRVHTNYGVIDPKTGKIEFVDAKTGKRETKQAITEPGDSLKPSNIILTSGVVDPKTGKLDSTLAQQFTIIEKDSRPKEREIHLVIITTKYDPRTKKIDPSQGHVDTVSGNIGPDGRIRTAIGIIDPATGEIVVTDPTTGKQEVKKAAVNPTTGHMIISSNVVDPKTGKIDPNLVQQFSIVNKPVMAHPKPVSKGEVRLVIITSKYDPYTKTVDAGVGTVDAAKGYVSDDGKIHTSFGIIDPRSGQILYKDPISGKQELKQADLDSKTGNLIVTTTVVDPRTGKVEPTFAQQLTIIDKQQLLAPVSQRTSVSPTKNIPTAVKAPIPPPLQSPVRTTSPIISSYAQKSSPVTPTTPKSPVKPTMAPPVPPKRKIVKIMVIFTRIDPKTKKPDMNTAEVEHLTGILDPNGLIETKYGVIDSRKGNIVITDASGQKQNKEGIVLAETGQVFINSGAFDPKTGKIDPNLGMILSVAKQDDPVVEITTFTGPIEPTTGKVIIEKATVEHTKGKVDADTGHISTKYGVIDPSNGVIFMTDTSDTKHVDIDENNGQITVRGVVDPRTGKPDPKLGQVIVVGTHIDPVVEVTTFVGKLDNKKGVIEPKHSLVESTTGQLNPENNKIDTKYGQIDLVKGTVTYNDPKTGKFESQDLKVDPVTGQFLLRSGQVNPKSGKPDKEIGRLICLRIIQNKVDPISGKQIVSNDPKNVKVDPKTNQIWVAGPKDPQTGDILYTAGQIDPTTGYIITIYGRLDPKTGYIIRTTDIDKILIKVDPVNGQIYTATGEVDENNQPLYSASQVDPGTGEIYTKLGRIDARTGRLIIIKIFVITQKDEKGRVKEVDPKECTIDETTGRIITTKTVYLYQIIDPITGETIDVDPDDPRLKGARTTVTQTMTLSGKIDPVTGRIKTEYGDIDPDTGDIDPSTAVRDPVTGQLILHYSQIDPSHFEDKSGNYTIEKETQDLPANIDIQTVNTHKFSTFGKDESPQRGDEPKTFTEYTTSEHIKHQGFVSSTTPLSSKIPISQRAKKTPTPPVVVKTTTKQLLTKNDEGVTHNVEHEVENLGTGEVTFSTHTNKAESLEPTEGKSPYVTARAVTTRTATTHHDLDTKAKTQQMEEKTVAHTLTSSATRQEQRVLTQEVKTMVTTGDQLGRRGSTSSLSSGDSGTPIDFDEAGEGHYYVTEPGSYTTSTTSTVMGNAPFGSMVYGTTARASTGAPPSITEVAHDAEDSEVVSSQTISSKTRTVETITYKTERNGVIETRVEQKITIQSDGDPIDHDRALAEAIQEATAMNPDMTVEKIEIQQQSTQP